MKTQIKQSTVLQFYTVDTDTGRWVSWANLLPVSVGVYSLFQVYTDPRDRGKGYGTELIEKVIAWAKKNQALIQFEVNGWGVIEMDNDQLCKWYLDMGFTLAGISNDGYPVLEFQGRRK